MKKNIKPYYFFIFAIFTLATCGSASQSSEDNEYLLLEDNEYLLPEDDEYLPLERSNPIYFEGRWIMISAGATRMWYEFYQNGEGIMSTITVLGMHDTPMTWSVLDDELELFLFEQPTPIVYYFEFLDDDTLALRRAGWSPYSAMTFEREQ